MIDDSSNHKKACMILNFQSLVHFQVEYMRAFCQVSVILQANTGKIWNWKVILCQEVRMYPKTFGV